MFCVTAVVVSEYFDCLWNSIPLRVSNRSLSSADVFASCSSRIFYSHLSRSYHLCDDVCHSDEEPSVVYCRRNCPGEFVSACEYFYTTIIFLIYDRHLTYGCESSYLDPFTCVADLPSRRGLHSSCSDCLVQPPVHRSTVGSRAFSVAGLMCGTACYRRLHRRHLWQPSALDLRHSCSLSCILTFGSSDIFVCIHCL